LIQMSYREWSLSREASPITVMLTKQVDSSGFSVQLNVEVKVEKFKDVQFENTMTPFDDEDTGASICKP
jgi:hypothetical protein